MGRDRAGEARDGDGAVGVGLADVAELDPHAGTLRVRGDNGADLRASDARAPCQAAPRSYRTNWSRIGGYDDHNVRYDRHCDQVAGFQTESSGTAGATDERS
ncbi:hypothetical protein GCM10022237_28180 [Nocardioides ginsengisoli]